VVAPAVDGRAVLLGAAVVLGVAVPVAAIGSLVVDEGSDAVFVLALLALVAIGAGGWLAGSRARRSPLATAALAAFAGFAVAQLVSLVLQAIDDDDINPAAVVFNALLATNVGLLGGWLAGATKRRA